jgi:mitochondrial chaperone BCS1
MLYYHDTHQKTTIYRPRHKEQRRDSSMWQQVAHRPVRPMNTVVLDSKEKHDVLADVNEYLHPRTPRWYAARGIPLRRGYLFHGPPGTGKTSFSFALAGVFGIDIYVISLQDASITEEDLAILFTRLPRRCIVLLEDIDTAGLRRNDDPKAEDEKAAEADKEKKKEGENGKPVVNGVSKAKSKKTSKKQDSDSEANSGSDSDSSEEERKAKQKRKAKAKKKKSDKSASLDGISLSGLLNAIDGVASHEGRVLIMTTNKPESLDEALVRPGRVDRQVAFSHATSHQAGELFHRMYEAPWRRSDQKIQAISPSNPSSILLTTSSSASNTKLAQEPEIAQANGTTKEKSVSEEELKLLSREFGKMIPANIFSPAEIQGFLLKRKNSPRKAFADVKEWIEATIKQKESKSKISTVQ